MVRFPVAPQETIPPPPVANSRPPTPMKIDERMERVVLVSDMSKKSFKFNPNASTFTPGTVDSTPPPPPPPQQQHPRVCPSVHAKHLQNEEKSPRPLRFQSFKPHETYPKLNLREFRRRDNLPEEVATDDKWPNRSETSYRMIFEQQIQRPTAVAYPNIYPANPVLPFPGYSVPQLPPGVVAYPQKYVGQPSPQIIIAKPAIPLPPSPRYLPFKPM
ncbi:hypothetical protein BdWA1_001620 [Babesia duncani]|uniref:Uncharacterized protein n=1 Tax=Babesia duncani TaxID=323732 RepID=A0AAD9UP05_9APIC|nr:hypothetical protein BdWA1_001620 [Babesia duncani]